MEIHFEEIKTLLPQKFPLLMVDKIISLEKGKKAVAIKNITGNEIFFLGHFPDVAVMPGALIIESMAQTAIIFFRKTYEKDDIVLEDKSTLFFLGAVKSRFLRPVVPGDQLQIEVAPTKVISTGGIVEATASVNDYTVAKAELTFKAAKMEDFQKA